MKKEVLVIAPIPLVLLFWGCPLESEYDLGSAMLPTIDKRVPGMWGL